MQYAPTADYGVAALPSLLIHARQEQPLFLLFNFLKDLKGRVLFTAESAGRREAFLTLLKDNGIAVKTLETWQDFLNSKTEMAVTVAPLENGFCRMRRLPSFPKTCCTAYKSSSNAVAAKPPAMPMRLSATSPTSTKAHP